MNQKATNQSEVRKTYIVSQAVINKIEGIAFWDRLKIKEVVHQALTEYISNWEKKNGPVKTPALKRN